jgi:hypothetical protein
MKAQQICDHVVKEMLVVKDSKSLVFHHISQTSTFSHCQSFALSTKSLTHLPSSGINIISCQKTCCGGFSNSFHKVDRTS